MSSDLKLYTYPNSAKSNKGLIVAKYAGIEVKLPQFQMGVDNKSPEFLAKFPTGKVPALETPEGPIFESNAIAKYIARKGGVLLGKTLYETALIDQWIDFSAEFEQPITIWVGPIFGYYPFDAAATDAAKKSLIKSLDVLNRHLLKHTYLVGETVTLADVCFAMTLLNPYKIVFDSEYRQSFPNVTRWFKTVVALPNVMAVVGPVELCTEMQVAKQSN